MPFTVQITYTNPDPDADQDLVIDLPDGSPVPPIGSYARIADDVHWVTYRVTDVFYILDAQHSTAIVSLQPAPPHITASH